MAYPGVDWQNKPNQTSPINRTNLEIMDNGIAANDAAITVLQNDKYKFVYAPTLTTNDIKSGYINANNGYVVSGNYVNLDYMEIPSSLYDVYLTVKSSFGSNVGCCFYNANKERISGITDDWGYKTITVKVPANAKYFRASMSNAIYTQPSDFDLSYKIYVATLLDDVNTMESQIANLQAEDSTIESNITSINSSINKLSLGEDVIGTFALGDIYNGHVNTSTYRMYAFYDTDNGVLNTLWNKYKVYVWQYKNSVWTGLGWQTSDYTLESGKYGFVVQRADSSTTDLTEAEQNEINANTKYITNSKAADNNLSLEIKKVKLAANFGRIMNRQGEGYGYPDNSLNGLISALNDGYKKIRVSVAVTSDSVFYCSHVYELANNAQLKYVKINGTIYPDNININEVDSEFMDSITYKDYPVPKLIDVMDRLVQYDAEITWELKAAFSSSQLESLIDLLKYYNMPVIVSVDYNLVPDVIAIDDNLDLAIIFQYTDARANLFINNYASHCKTLRFDCYWSDTIGSESVINVIHPNYKLKLGGTNVSYQTVLDAMKYCDVCEAQFKLSNIDAFNLVN